MKANEMPDKVYIHKSPFWGLMANYEDITKNGIEYIKKDVFIEKADNYLRNNCQRFILTEKDIEDFKNYMKGD